MTKVIIAGRIDPVRHAKEFDNNGNVKQPAYYMGSNLGLTEHNVKNLSFGTNRMQMLMEMIEIAYKAKMTA